jgi:hypothetical protein
MLHLSILDSELAEEAEIDGKGLGIGCESLADFVEDGVEYGLA